MAVVRVHHPVDKAQPHPLCNKARLCGHGCAQKLLDRLGCVIMPLYGLVQERFQRLGIIARSEILKCTHPNVA